MSDHDSIRAVRWTDSGLELLDQRILPHQETCLLLEQCSDVAQAITNMVVRGAPAIGVTAAYAAVLAARARYSAQPADWKKAFAQDMQQLAQARPTAVKIGRAHV